MTDTVIGISIVLPDFQNFPDRGREDTLIENLLFDNIVMDRIYGRPIKIYIGQTDDTRCEGIRNIYFSKIMASGLEFPYPCGTTTEWFSDHDYEAPHPIKNEGYKKWRNDPNANLPETDALDKIGDVFLGKDENEVYLARKFHNELIADLILYFAEEAQSVIKK